MRRQIKMCWRIWATGKTDQKLKQAGTGQSLRHIQGSKIAKGLPSVNLQYWKIEEAKKIGPSGALKGDTSEIVNIFAAEWGPFGEETNFQKKSHNAEKLKGETLWDF